MLNKDNSSKVVNAITGTPETIDMTGTWNYKGSAVEFEAENLSVSYTHLAVGVKAESAALQNGIASLYPDINGLPELKKRLPTLSRH